MHIQNQPNTQSYQPAQLQNPVIMHSYQPTQIHQNKVGYIDLQRFYKQHLMAQLKNGFQFYL